MHEQDIAIIQLVKRHKKQAISKQFTADSIEDCRVYRSWVQTRVRTEPGKN